MQSVSKYFINGLIVLIPIAITIFVIIQVFSFTENLLGRYLPIHFPGLGLITVLLLILLIGWLSSYYMLKRVLAYGEKLLSTIPVVKFIYSSVKQLSTAVFESKNVLNKPVLVKYPSENSWALGFIMSDLTSPIKDKLPEDHICIFVPMSLNITAGFNIIVSMKDIIPLDIPGESALKYVLSAGMIMPNTHHDSKG